VSLHLVSEKQGDTQEIQTPKEIPSKPKQNTTKCKGATKAGSHKEEEKTASESSIPQVTYIYNLSMGLKNSKST